MARAQTAAAAMTSSDPRGPIVGVVGYGVTGRRLGTYMLRQGTNVAIFDPAVSGSPRGAVAVARAADLGVTDVVALCHPHPHAELAADYLTGGVSVV